MKMSKTHIGVQSGKNHPLFGKHHSEESKKKMSEKLKGRTLSEETKQKIRHGLKRSRELKIKGDTNEG